MQNKCKSSSKKVTQKGCKDRQGTFLCISLARVGNAPTQQRQTYSRARGGILNFQIALHRKPLLPKDIDAWEEADESWPHSIDKQCPKLTIYSLESVNYQRRESAGWDSGSGIDRIRLISSKENS